MSDDEKWTFGDFDVNIHYHERAAMDLKIRRNRRAPINKLPRDMLLEIFLAVRDSDQESPRPKDLLRVTQVCALWRDIAINTVVLWTRPSAHTCGSQWTELALERSKRAPLDILWNLDHSRESNVVIIFEEAWRIKTIHIKGHSYSLYNLYDELPESAPQLQDLRICCEVAEDDEADEEFQVWTLSPTAFQDSPKLRRLTLENVYFKYEMLVHTNLISLSLKPLNRNALPSWIQLTDILRRMTLLEELRLDGAFPATGAHVPHMQPINIPHLKALQVHTQTLSQLQTFLSLMKCPSLENLSLDWDTDDSPEYPHPETMFRTAAALIDAAKHGSDFTTLEISETVVYLFKTRCVARSERGYSVDITFPTSEAELDTMEDIRDLVRALRLEHVTHLSLDSENCDFLNIQMLLLDLPLVQTASIGGTVGYSFFESLAPATIATPGDSAVPLNFPLRYLKSVIWRDVSCEDSVVRVHEESINYILERRINEGVALQELIFQNVEYLTFDLLDIFKNVIARVVVE